MAKKNIKNMSYRALIHYMNQLKEGGKAWERCIERACEIKEGNQRLKAEVQKIINA